MKKKLKFINKSVDEHYEKEALGRISGAKERLREELGESHQEDIEELKHSFDEKFNKKNNEIISLKEKHESELLKKDTEKNETINSFNSQIKNLKEQHEDALILKDEEIKLKQDELQSNIDKFNFIVKNLAVEQKALNEVLGKGVALFIYVDEQSLLLNKNLGLITSARNQMKEIEQKKKEVDNNIEKLLGMAKK